jgi:2-aminoadipate transaminase
MTASSSATANAFRPSAAAERMRPNAIRALAPLLSRPGLLSFAGGVPSTATFPGENLALIAERLIRDHGATVLQYGTTHGNRDLLGLVVERVRGRGLPCAGPEEVLLTSGSQQALDLVARVFLDPGEVVFVELPSYIGGLASLWAAGAELVGFRLGQAGPDLDHLEEQMAAVAAAGRRARAIYTIPTFQNPSGVTSSAEARAGLLELADRHDLLVIEDDPYGEVYFDHTKVPPPPIAALDQHGRTIYLGSFSKVLCPGLRAGWVVAPPHACRRLELAKEAADLCSSSLDHAIVAEAVATGLIDERLPSIRGFYAARCGAMLAALEKHATPGSTWTRPGGGLFIWVELPAGCDSRATLDSAVNAGVAYVPGAPFFVDGSGTNTLRLAFSREEPAAMDRGIGTLFDVLREHR